MTSEIKVLATTAMKTSLDELAPDFERATGNKLSFSFGPSARITKMVADGEETDVAIVTDQGLKDLTQQGKLVPGSGADIARSAMALAVQKGAAKPDISSGAKFKAALLAAKSLGMSNPVGGGQSGANLVEDFRQARHHRGDENKVGLRPGRSGRADRQFPRPQGGRDRHPAIARADGGARHRHCRTAAGRRAVDDGILRRGCRRRPRTRMAPRR